MALRFSAKEPGTDCFTRSQTKWASDRSPWDTAVLESFTWTLAQPPPIGSNVSQTHMFLAFLPFTWLPPHGMQNALSHMFVLPLHALGHWLWDHTAWTGSGTLQLHTYSTFVSQNCYFYSNRSLMEVRNSVHANCCDQKNAHDILG